jgi:hypothetical protein
MVFVFMGVLTLFIFWGSVFRRRRTHHCFEHSSQFAARQHDPALAIQAFQANIGTQSSDLPLVAATRVLLAQTEHIIEMKFG